jgi:hypothetical protein
MRDFLAIDTYGNTESKGNVFATPYQKRNIEEEAKKDKTNKAIYDKRAELQKQLANLKKQHDSSFMGLFAKPWTPAETEELDRLNFWIKTYNETVAIIENGVRRTPPKTSVETPKNPSWMKQGK